MKAENIIALLFAALIGYLTYLIMLPFFVPIFWAVIFVILFHPYYKWLERRLRHSGLASFVACLSIALFFIVPMIVLGATLTGEVVDLYQRLESYIKGLSPDWWSQTYVLSYIEKTVGRYVDISTMDIQKIAARALREASTYVAGGVKGAIKNFAQFFFNVFLAFFTMFFLFIESGNLLEVVKDIIPLPARRKEELLAKNRVIITATFTGGVLVGAVQGFLGGVAFWFLGISSPFLWGFVMFIMSFLPGIGTMAVIVPAVVYLFIAVSTIKAIALAVWGALVIGLADNILRPLIVSGRTRQHPLLLFMSILGAVHAFGLIGIIAGPIILSIAHAALDIYRSTVKETGDGS